MRALALALLLAAAGRYGEGYKHDPRDDGPDALDVSGYPPEMQARYPTVAVKCAKCHPLARTINSRMEVADWKRYMKKMIRRPNSGVNEEQAVDIYEFLKYFSTQQAAGK